jgi:hypothetical protein
MEKPQVHQKIPRFAFGTSLGIEYFDQFVHDLHCSDDIAKRAESDCHK